MSKSPSKVLLMELDSVCGTLLQAADFELERTGRPAEGLEKLATHRFDLIVLELAAADNYGLNLLSQFRAAAPQTPIVVITGSNDEEMASRSIWMGAHDYFFKAQLNGPALINAIRKTIDRHRCQLTHNYEGVLLQTLMENISDAIYFKDARSRFLMISQAQARKFGLADPREAIGRTDADYFSRPHAEQALADEQKILRSGQPMVDIEESETWPDGSVTWVSTTKMPLRNEAGRVVGTFGVSRDITKRKHAEEALAERTEQLQKKNRQIVEELKMARELQLAMLPQNFPSIPNRRFPDQSALNFFSFFIPSGAVSGDFFDVVALSDTAVGVFICDVMGHDVRAALVTAMMRALVEDLSGTTTDPGQLLTQINLCLFNVFRQAEATMYATAFYLVADVVTGEVCYACAAHPNPLHLHQRQGSVEALGGEPGGKKGPALGLFKAARFPTYRRQMNPGDLIVLYTDGMIEAEGLNEEIFSQERLMAAVSKHAGLPAKKLLIELLAEIRQFSGQSEFTDDICLVGVEFKA